MFKGIMPSDEASALIFEVNKDVKVVLIPQEPPFYSRLRLYDGSEERYNTSIPSDKVERIVENKNAEPNQLMNILKELELEKFITAIENLTKPKDTDVLPKTHRT